jgi:hypothetical protein
LEPTLTYHHRSWCFHSLGLGFVVVQSTMPDGEVIEESLPGDGLLTIRCQSARGRALPGVREFHLLKLHDLEQREPYRVRVGGVNECRCQAGQCRVPSGCKHRDALAALIAAGGLEPAELSGVGGYR